MPLIFGFQFVSLQEKQGTERVHQYWRSFSQPKTIFVLLSKHEARRTTRLLRLKVAMTWRLKDSQKEYFEALVGKQFFVFPKKHKLLLMEFNFFSLNERLCIVDWRKSWQIVRAIAKLDGPHSNRLLIQLAKCTFQFQYLVSTFFHHYFITKRKFYFFSFFFNL